MANRTPYKRHDQSVFRWAIGLSVGFVVALVFSLVFVDAWFGRPNYYVGTYDASRSIPVVSFRGVVWQRSGPLVRIADAQMVAVGYSDQGTLLYVPQGLTGGGGGRPEFGAKPDHFEHVYLRTKGGFYQPFKR